MPYDSIPRSLLEQPPVAVPFDFERAAPRERLAALATALEHPETWRGRIMNWTFSTVLRQDCLGVIPNGCALGLACLMWPQMRTHERPCEAALLFFGLEKHACHSIFFTSYNGRDCSPAHIAYRIRRYLNYGIH